jgi:hypothetical protein
MAALYGCGVEKLFGIPKMKRQTVELATRLVVTTAYRPPCLAAIAWMTSSETPDFDN